MTTCGDITVFKIDQTTGRLSLVVNAQVTAASGQPITYFPVPANPVDFLISSGSRPHAHRRAQPTSYPYVGGTVRLSVQLFQFHWTVDAEPEQRAAARHKQGTAIVSAAA